MSDIRIARLGQGDLDVAKTLFRLMAEVFGEEREPLGDEYVDRLLSDADFWAVAARQGDEVIGGLTAHRLPMTRTEAAELLIYDIAVRTDAQRKGIGRQLVDDLRRQAAALGIGVLFVLADAEDAGAVEFYRAVGGDESDVALFAFSDPEDKSPQ
jgi:aminoglycoside 3-N-acetyltransferase I